MLKRIKTLDTETIKFLCSFANMSVQDIITGKEIDKTYIDLYVTSSLPENKHNKLDVSNVIDQLMFDNYDFYLKLKERHEQIDMLFENENVDNMFEQNVDNMFEQSKKMVERYIEIYENLLLECKFEQANIRQIQKFELEQELKYNIEIENYEYCSILKKKIDEV
jgi:hypothetical protein